MDCSDGEIEIGREIERERERERERKTERRDSCKDKVMGAGSFRQLMRT